MESFFLFILVWGLQGQWFFCSPTLGRSGDKPKSPVSAQAETSIPSENLFNGTTSQKCADRLSGVTLGVPWRFRALSSAYEKKHTPELYSNPPPQKKKKRKKKGRRQRNGLSWSDFRQKRFSLGLVDSVRSYGRPEAGTPAGPSAQRLCLPDGTQIADRGGGWFVGSWWSSLGGSQPSDS